MIQNWKLVLVVFLGITIAATLIAGGPIYLKSLRRIGFAASIDSSLSAALNILTIASDVRVETEELERVEGLVENTVRDHLASIYEGHERYLNAFPSNAIQPDTPIDNIITCFHTARDFDVASLGGRPG